MSDLVYITEHARETPDKPAVIMAGSGRVTTFRELEENSNRAAHLFRSLGLDSRCHVAMVIENRPEFFDACFKLDRPHFRQYQKVPTFLPSLRFVSLVLKTSMHRFLPCEPR